MNKLLLSVHKMEKCAFAFIRGGLESVLLALFLLFVKTRAEGTLYGVERVMYCKEMCECIAYIMLTVTLVIGGGLFMDFAIKHETDT